MTKCVMIVVGPTGSGKSSFALEEAGPHQGVIINADSLQLYQGLPLLTAQPTDEDLRKAPHLLYSIFPPHAPQTSAAAWRALAVEAIEETLQQKKTSWIVGGTGFYIKALLSGLSPMPAIAEEIKQTFKKRTASEATSFLFNRLKQEDPVMAGRLAPQDRQRILRALLVHEATGHSLSFWQSQPREKTGYDFKIIYRSPPRPVLHRQIEKRFQRMLHEGAIEEVEIFLKREEAHTSPLTAAIGFRQIADFLHGKLSQEEVFEKVIFASRQYAKRQKHGFAISFPALDYG